MTERSLLDLELSSAFWNKLSKAVELLGLVLIYKKHDFVCTTASVYKGGREGGQGKWKFACLLDYVFKSQ